MSASEDGKSAQQQLDTAKDQLKWLDNLMGSNDYVCGERYSICDSILFGQLWFFCISPGFGAPLGPLIWDAADLDIPWVKTWYARVAARPVTAKCVAGYLDAQVQAAAAAAAEKAA